MLRTATACFIMVVVAMSPAAKGSDVVDELQSQIDKGQITFDTGKEQKLREELLGKNSGTKVTETLQRLVLALSNIKGIRISSIIRSGGLHEKGRAVDIGNEEIAKHLLSAVATDAKVAVLQIDEIIFDAAVAGQSDRNKWNYDAGKKHTFSNETLNDHKDHIHFSVRET